MATTAEKLLVQIEASTESLRREMRRAEQAVGTGSRKITRETRKIEGSFSNLNRTLSTVRRSLGALGLGLSVGAMQNFALSAVRAADAIDKASQRIGVGAETLQEFQFAASQSGVAANEFEQAMIRLNQRIAQGQVQYKDAESGLAEIADAVKNAGSETERARLVYEAFGRSGARLLPMLRNGAEGLARYREEARQLGLVMDQETITRAARFGDELSKLTDVARTAAQSGVLRTLTQQTDDLRTIYADPAFQEGMRIIGDMIGFIGRESLASATSIGHLAQAIRNLDPSALLDVGVLGLGRRTLEDLGLLEQGIEGVGESAGDAKKPTDDLGNTFDNLGGSAGGAADRLASVANNLERQIERSTLMVRAMQDSEAAVDRLNLEFEIYDNLLAAGAIPETASLAEALELSTSMADDNARKIGDLTHTYHNYQKRLEAVREAQKLERQAANDNARAAEEEARQQAARFVRVAPETIEAAQQDFADLFGEVVA